MTQKRVPQRGGGKGAPSGSCYRGVCLTMSGGYLNRLSNVLHHGADIHTGRHTKAVAS